MIPDLLVLKILRLLCWPVVHILLSRFKLFFCWACLILPQNHNCPYMMWTVMQINCNTFPCKKLLVCLFNVNFVASVLLSPWDDLWYLYSSRFPCVEFLCCSYAHCILTIRRSYLMSWNPLLICSILESSQIVLILEVAMVNRCFMWLTLHLIMCHQSSLVSLLLTRKLFVVPPFILNATVMLHNFLCFPLMFCALQNAFANRLFLCHKTSWQWSQNI